MRCLITRVLIPVVMSCPFVSLSGQAGQVDPWWNPLDMGYGIGAGATSGFSVKALAIQPDGRLIIGGSFTEYNTTPRARIARLLTDGTVDHSFDPGAGANDEVTGLVMQPDGKVLVCGGFSNLSGHAYVARLLSTGATDTGFGSASSPDGPVHALALRGDGKVMLAGQFNQVGWAPRPHIARLNSDGTLDITFDAGSGTDQMATELVVQADDKVIIAGPFQEVNGVPRPRIARLNSDGTVDATFVVGSGFGPLSDVHALLLQPDGRLVVGGSFTSYNGTPAPRIIRLMPDGSVDPSFDPGTGFNGDVHVLALRADGRIIAGGSFTGYDGVPHTRLVRLMPDGIADPTFTVGQGPNSTVLALAEQPDGKMVYAGSFHLHGDRHRAKLGRVHVDGSLDLAYNGGTGATGNVNGIWEQTDGRILLAGAFLSYNDTLAGRVVRVSADGLVDTSFHAANGVVTPGGSIHDVVVQPDGRILLGGSFASYGSMSGDDIVRLLPNGEVDTSFDVGSGANGIVRALALQPDGRILIGGQFTQVNGIARNRVARLEPDGSLDLSFDPGSGANNAIWAVALQPDGKVLVGGSFTTYNGTTVRRLARLLPDGTLDPAFDHQYGVYLGNVVYHILVEPDGRILIGGDFDSYDLVPLNDLARLLQDGNVDPTFPGNLNLNGYVTSLGQQADGRILIGGAFTVVDGMPRQHIARLNTDGTHDLSFDPGLGAEGEAIGYVYRLRVLSTGHVLIGGAFTRVDGIGRNHVARLYGSGSVAMEDRVPAQPPVWMVHPVPTMGPLHVDPLEDAVTLELIDARGARIVQLPFNLSIDLSICPAGLYTLVARDAAGVERGRKRVLRMVD